MPKFVFSNHAQERMLLRKITRTMVKDAVLGSDYTETGEFGRLLAFKAFPGRLLKVVYVKERKIYFIISVIWARKRI